MEHTKNKLPQYLDTNEEWNMWEQHLLNQSKEDLVQCLLSRMAMDHHFMQFMYINYANCNQNSDMNQCMDSFLAEIDYELQEKNPDVDYLVSITERFFQTICQFSDSVSKVKAYLVIICKLNVAVLQGAGTHDDSWLLFDRMDDAKNYAIQIIKEETLSQGERKKIKDLCKQALKGYHSADDQNRVEDILIMLE